MLPVLAPTDVRWLVVPLYLLRTWLMNCTSGLTKSVLNDYVTRQNRGKWNALESVNLFSWSGSSILGGHLITMYGFNTAFFITAVLQAVSIACLLPLLPIVHAETSSRVRAARAPSGEAAARVVVHSVSVAPLVASDTAASGCLQADGAAAAPTTSISSASAARSDCGV